MSVSETAPPPSVGSETYHKKPCPIGYYCPPLASAPLPCPPGTRGSTNLAKDIEDCQACPAGMFNHLPAQAACFPCGSSSSSQPGELLFLSKALPAVKREPNRITCKCDFPHMLPQWTASCGIFVMLCVLTTPTCSSVLLRGWKIPFSKLYFVLLYSASQGVLISTPSKEGRDEQPY